MSGILTDSIGGIGYLQALNNYYDAQELKKIKRAEKKKKPLTPDEEYQDVQNRIKPQYQ